MFKILLPIDVNQLETKLPFRDRAIAYAKAFEGRFYIMTVMADYGSYFVSPLLPENFIETAKAKALASLETFVTHNIPNDLVEGLSVRYGAVHTEIIAAAEQAQIDVIFLGADDPEPVDLLLGTSASRVIRQAPCDVVFFQSR